MKNEDLREHINLVVGKESNYSAVIIDNLNEETYTITFDGVDMQSFLHLLNKHIITQQMNKAQDN